jgi:hypothetical protein
LQAARVAADHATQRGHSVVVGAVDPATTGARKGRWGDAAQPTSGGWAVHSRGSHRPGGDKGASPLRVPFDPRYPEGAPARLLRERERERGSERERERGGENERTRRCACPSTRATPRVRPPAS